MGLFEIIIIVIGLFIIVMSYVMSEIYMKQDSGNENSNLSINDEGVHQMVNRIAEAAVQKTEDELCKVSNEKIMAVSEYGDSVLEKIHKSHSEVLFLYSMLNDKEEELKRFVNQDMIQDNDITSSIHPVEEKHYDQQEPILEEVTILGEQAKKLNEMNVQQSEEVDFDTLYSEYGEEYADRKQMILELVKQGKSVTEISKELKVGQGEVYLVMNLFQGESK